MTAQPSDDDKGKRFSATDGLTVRIVCGAIAIAALGALVWGGWRVSRALDAATLGWLIDGHGPALIGIPLAVGIATVVTGAARAIDGKIGFDLPGVRAEGAAASGILWVAVFLAVTIAIRALW